MPAKNRIEINKGENRESGEIAEHLFHKQGRFMYSTSEKQEMVEYVEKVINSKLKK